MTPLNCCRLSVIATLLFAPLVNAIDRIPLKDFAEPMEWDDVQLSPSGKYLAGSLIGPDEKMIVAILDLDTKKHTAIAGLRNDQQVGDIYWVNDERLLFSARDRYGSLAAPVDTGEIFGLGVEGKSVDALFGYRASGMQTGTYIKQKAENAWGHVIDTLRHDDKNVLISVRPFGGSQHSEVRRMNVKTGKTQSLLTSKMPISNFDADHDGVVRVQSGQTATNFQHLHYRADEEAPWELINDEAKSRQYWDVLGFSADNQSFYVSTENASGPDSILLYDAKTKATKEVYRHAYSDPLRYLYGIQDGVPIGVIVQEGQRKAQFFNPSHPDVALYKRLEGAFPGNLTIITSASNNGKKAIVLVESSTNSGDYYLFDTKTSSAEFLVSRSKLMDPELLSPSTPIALKARDGLQLHGYLTLPRRAAMKKNLPMIVMPHGGPYGIFDRWQFDAWTQVLADHGYAVLAINFRGSGGYGRAFRFAGYREWGGKIQDDITDATQWAIKEGYADAKRICIAGGSFGGYAALMGVAREPDLYRCALSYVGVTDLPLMFSRGDINDTVFGVNYLKAVLGEDETELAQRSPVNLAAAIKVPVFLVHGVLDQRVPVAHAERMRSALEKAGKKVKYLAVSGEGHGFYRPRNNLDFYRQQLDFFAEHIGGERPQ